jgi:hypothetical protein
VETSGNRISIGGELEERQLEVSIIDKKNDEVVEAIRYADVKMDQHKILITPRIQ